jgi:hypothetical protein
VAEDPLDTVLRLVVEGRLTADEAGPILAALDARPDAKPEPTGSHTASESGARPLAGDAEPLDAAGGGGRSLRIEVRDAGRTVVNLRLPLALGRYALDRVPGLSGDQVERVKAALSSGLTGPVLVVDDEDGGVRIAID